MSYHQLPRLTEDSRVPAIASSGKWEWLGEKVLSDLSDSLRADVNPQFFDVDALPDIWARPLLFNLAFCNSSHPLHEKVIGEWRGMMALIALSQWRDYPLSLLNISLPDSEDDSNHQGDVEDGHRFPSVASRMAPRKSVDQDTHWTNLHLFLYEGQPIALSSPLTLVSTATAYRAHGVPWYNGQILRDPIGRYGASEQIEDVLNAQERTALARWIDHLEDLLRQDRRPPSDSPISDAADSWENLLGALHEFSSDLASGGTSDGMGSSVQVRGNVFGARGDGLLQHLDSVLERPAPDLENSHVRLIEDPELDTRDRPVLLVIGDEIAEQWDERPQDVIVHGVDTLASVRNVAGGRGSLNRKVVEGGEWRRASDLFTDRIAIIEQKNAFNESATYATGSGLGGQVTPALPLKKELLYYRKPEDLARRVRITKKSNEEQYRVQLDLPLAGPGSEPRDVTFEHVYEPEDVVVNDTAPFFDVWPDFVAADWSEYYTFYSGPGKFYLKAYPEPGPEDISAERLRHGEVQRAIAQMDQYPTAALCFGVGGEEYLGFVATVPPERASATVADTQVVGVDFGTSNTTVYVSESGGPPEPMRFEDRLISITAERKLRLTRTRNFFIPAREQEFPFLTFFHHLPTAQSANPGPTVDVLTEGHILYLHALGQRKEVSTGEVHHDLKWSKSSADRARTHAFLEQIVLQARAEATARRINDIEWRYSFPTSFSEGQKKSIKETWRSLVNPEKLEAKSESLSTATYFLDAQNARLADGSICIDIGGASADVTVWQNGNMLLQTSILIASQEILLKSIAAEMSAFQPVFKDEDFSDIVQKEGSLQETITDLEELLVLKGDKFLANLPQFSSEAPIVQLRQRLALGVCGIFYYAGLLVRYLTKEGRYDLSNEGLPDIYFGGNGSKLLHWLAQGTFRGRDSLVGDLFKKVLVEAAEFSFESADSTFTVQLTPEDRVKHEVAFGLVSGRNLTVTDGSPVIAGESFVKQNASGGSVTWDSALTADLLSEGIDIQGQLNHLQRLIEMINDFSEDHRELFEPVPVSDQLLREARGRIRDYLQDLSGEEKQDIDVEPIFVLGVKAYLDVLRES